MPVERPRPRGRREPLPAPVDRGGPRAPPPASDNLRRIWTWPSPGADGASAPAARATRPRGIDAWLDAPRGGNDLGRSAVRRIHRPRTGHVLVVAPAGYFAAFFLRSAQEAVIRSEAAFFSSAVIGRRFLVGLASDAVSATGVAAAAGRREEERRAAGFAGAEVPSILSTSFNASISACRRSISLWRSAIAFAMTLISFPRGCIVRRSPRSGLRLRARSNGLRF